MHKQVPGASASQDQLRRRSKERKNQPFIQRDEDASTRTTNTKMSTFNVNTFSQSSNAENGRKAQRLLPISTSTSPLLPPATAANSGCKAYKFQKWAGGLNGRERGVANERVISNILPDHIQHTSLLYCVLGRQHHVRQEVTCATRQAGKPRRGALRR
ncbi:hypothetical protein PSV08DRAFT_265255 [Bipolaris maydis]|uniref:uncharacterized protein n=1 Tax=Cochliobolus heterostrophus TaxID=5016 RepID=UPI0024D559E7|nr:hypothetical protein PSV08DRAFT_265255 [Bipolaris maydis]